MLNCSLLWMSGFRPLCSSRTLLKKRWPSAEPLFNYL
jgi:hypothetical protein